MTERRNWHIAEANHDGGDLLLALSRAISPKYDRMNLKNQSAEGHLVEMEAFLLDFANMSE